MRKEVLHLLGLHVQTIEQPEWFWNLAGTSCPLTLMSTKLLLSWDTVSAHNCFSCANIVCMGDSTLVYRLFFATLENTVISFLSPPKFCITIVFSFSWDDSKFQEKLKTMVMQNFLGKKKIIVVFSKVANWINTCTAGYGNNIFNGHTQESAVNFIVGFILPQKCSIKVVFLNICSKYGYL